jgi:hypothetical protein
MPHVWTCAGPAGSGKNYAANTLACERLPRYVKSAPSSHSPLHCASGPKFRMPPEQAKSAWITGGRVTRFTTRFSEIRRKTHQHNHIVMVCDRLIGIMPAAFKRLRPEMRSKPACLSCGKRLTDPVSMARCIGSECAGTAASSPFTVNLSA